MTPPERLVVLCVDGKSQIQALDRSLPMRAGQVECRSLDLQAATARRRCSSPSISRPGELLANATHAAAPPSFAALPRRH